MRLGPYTTGIKRYIDIDVDGHEDPESIGFVVPDQADNFLHEIGALDLDITLSAGEVKIEWGADLREGDWGFDLDNIYVNRVSGVLKFDVLVPDPLSDGDYQEFEHSMQFDSGKDDDWFVDDVNYGVLSLDRGVSPTTVEIDVKKKTVEITF